MGLTSIDLYEREIAKNRVVNIIKKFETKFNNSVYF